MLRITGGAWRGRRLRPLGGKRVRPTESRVRQALLQIWAHAGLLDAPFLDLFAGSGIMALEALSRGVPRAVSIEAERAACARMRRIQAEWGVERWTILCGRLPAALRRIAGARFGVVFADPPYRSDEAERIPGWLDAHGIGCAELAIELPADEGFAAPRGWRVADLRRWGGSAVVRLVR
ncbi:MAG: 16S rRNA (guanine(966)-N(2))-methyltransferase RsmD [Zetaproteobacteria bacterium]|nr:MAG: 16S rRNA (guanine(966)-N(2))-methyltransferase RsmD [Zetaproteobacteria bacterium]